MEPSATLIRGQNGADLARVAKAAARVAQAQALVAKAMRTRDQEIRAAVYDAPKPTRRELAEAARLTTVRIDQILMGE